MNKIVDYVYSHLPYDVFTDKEVAQMTFDNSKDSRYGLVRRALKAGDIIRIRRGLYCLAKKFQRYPLDLFSTAQMIYGPSYISMESALSHHGWIPEGIFQTISTSMLRSRCFKTPVGEFSYCRVTQDQFFAHVERIAAEKTAYFMAKPLKALCDYVYIHKESWVSIDPLVESLRIDEEMLSRISREDLDQLFLNYHSRRVKVFLKGVKKDLGL